jgi:23S rRNA (uracil1939-C5)-methyltransferase
MFMNYEAQVSAKQKKLASALTSLNATHLSCRVKGSVRQFGYRNRAQLKTNGRELGYLRASSHDLTDIETCAVLTDTNQVLLSRLRNSLPNSAWRPRSKQKWITLDIDDQRDAPIIDKRQPFRQANDSQNAIMRDWLADKLTSLVPEGPVLELFCGNGNLTSVVAECSPHAQVVAVEGDAMALEALAALNIASVTTERVNLFDDRQIRALISALPSINGVVLDPPRDGLKARDAFGCVFSECSWVVYISCNLATWQRDAQFLQDQGLRLTQVEGLDMFPQTPHLEVLSVFERQ